MVKDNSNTRGQNLGLVGTLLGNIKSPNENTNTTETEESAKPLAGVRRGRQSKIRNRFYTSISLDRDRYDIIRTIALTNKVNINEIFDVALSMYIEAYEAIHGPVSSRESNISAKSLISPEK